MIVPHIDYPFGLKQKGYNNVLNGEEYPYKYQGQERQNELGLNWDSYKWRNYDYAIGRFFNVDPLAEKFPYMTVYQFAGNKPIWSQEIEGLESGVDVMMHVRDMEVLGANNVVQNSGGQNMLKKVFNWIKNSLFSHDSSSGYSKVERVPGSGVEITNTPFSGNSGRCLANHPEDNVEVDFNDLMAVTGITKGHTFPKNAAEAFKVIVDATETAENIMSSGTDSISDSGSNSTMNSQNQQDIDTTYTVQEPSGYTIIINSDVQVTGITNVKKNMVTTLKSQVNNTIKAAQQRIKNNETQMEKKFNKL